MFYAALIAFTSVLDLALKSGVESQPDTSYPKEVKGTGGIVQVRKLHNEGFPMGIMKEKPELVRCLPLAVASSLLLRLSCLQWRVLCCSGFPVCCRERETIWKKQDWPA